MEQDANLELPEHQNLKEHLQKYIKEGMLETTL